MKPLFSRFVFLGFLALILLGAGCSRSSPSVSDRPFRIGSFLPLSGDLSALGQEIQRGAEIAKAELEREGTKIEYVSEDDQFKSTASVQAANKLLNVDRVDAVFTATVQESKPVVGLFRDKQRPLLVAWDSNAFLKNAGESVFSIGFSTEASGQRMAEYAYRELGLRKIAMLQHVDEFSELIGTAFESRFKELGGRIVLAEKRQVGEKDYRTFLGKVKNSGADGFYFPLIPPVHGPLLNQAKQLGLNIKFLGADGLIQDEIKEAGTAAEGVYYTNIYAEQPEMISRKYRERYQMDPADPTFVTFGYDSVMVLVQALRTAREKGIPVTEALKQADVPGAGSRIRMNGSRFSERVERIYQVKDGAPLLIKE